MESETTTSEPALAPHDAGGGDAPSDLPRVLTDVYNYITADRESLDEAGCDDALPEVDALLRRIKPHLPQPPLPDEAAVLALAGAGE